MKGGEGKTAKWMVFKGGRLHNWFIARPDCHGMRKADIVERGTLNVHYFHTVEAAVYWYNSYQLRINELSSAELGRAMTSVKNNLDAKPAGALINHAWHGSSSNTNSNSNSNSSSSSSSSSTSTSTCSPVKRKRKQTDFFNHTEQKKKGKSGP
jgi:hypothetical protein